MKSFALALGVAALACHDVALTTNASCKTSLYATLPELEAGARIAANDAGNLLTGAGSASTASAVSSPSTRTAQP